MRPHNKSTLWDEYLEHYDREKKYFNTKHKRAFCKRCIFKAVEDITNSPQAQAEFQASGFAAGWEVWAYRQAFERVEGISGRSSNMQNHVRGCQQISLDDRARIMTNFRASATPQSTRSFQSSSSTSTITNDPEMSNYSEEFPRIAQKIQARPPAPGNSDAQWSRINQESQLSWISKPRDDVDMNDRASSSSSPKLNRQRNIMAPRQASCGSQSVFAPVATKKVTLKSILNEDVPESPQHKHSYSGSSVGWSKGKGKEIVSSPIKDMDIIPGQSFVVPSRGTPVSDEVHKHEAVYPGITDRPADPPSVPQTSQHQNQNKNQNHYHQQQRHHQNHQQYKQQQHQQQQQHNDHDQHQHQSHKQPPRHPHLYPPQHPPTHSYHDSQYSHTVGSLSEHPPPDGNSAALLSWYRRQLAACQKHNEILQRHNAELIARLEANMNDVDINMASPSPSSSSVFDEPVSHRRNSSFTSTSGDTMSRSSRNSNRMSTEDGHHKFEDGNVEFEVEFGVVGHHEMNSVTPRASSAPALADANLEKRRNLGFGLQNSFGDVGRRRL